MECVLFKAVEYLVKKNPFYGKLQPNLIWLYGARIFLVQNHIRPTQINVAWIICFDNILITTICPAPNANYSSTPENSVLWI